MRILLKFPTRSRPQKAVATLAKYLRLANHPERIGVAVSCDTDDTTMTRNIMQEEVRRVLRDAEWGRIFFRENRSKIEACNANMDEVDYPWDIVVLVSDDMIPQVKGYDDAIRSHMMSSFPDTNGILWFNDGFQENKLNTLCVFGRKMYQHFGYIYHPAYKSLFCDTELTDLCKTTLKDKCVYISHCIIRHEHPGTGFSAQMDGLYATNQKYWNEDMYTYISRKAYAYDWSVLIPTIAGRENQLQSLVASLHEKTKRICPALRMEIKLAYDNRETSVGIKRQQLLDAAAGKYLSFVDDDDEITDAYIEDLWACIQGGFHVMRLQGKMIQDVPPSSVTVAPNLPHPGKAVQDGGYTFVHSLETKLTDFMARDGIFIRPPNHLNPMMADVAKLIRFQNATYGEDLDWCIRLSKAGFLSREYRSDSGRVHYLYSLGTRAVHSFTYHEQEKTNFETMLKMIYTPVGAIAPAPPPQPISNASLRWSSRGFVSK